MGTHGHLPKRRRIDTLHESAGDNRVALGDGATGRFVNFSLANAGGMHIGFMGEVHQVVDHQAVVTRNVVLPSPVGPSRIVKPFKDGHFVGIYFGSIARPDPDKPVTLNDRKTFDRLKSSDLVTRHAEGVAIATHDEAMIATDQLPIADAAQ